MFCTIRFAKDRQARVGALEWAKCKTGKQLRRSRLTFSHRCYWIGSLGAVTMAVSGTGLYGVPSDRKGFIAAWRSHRIACMCIERSRAVQTTLRSARHWSNGSPARFVRLSLLPNKKTLSIGSPDTISTKTILAPVVLAPLLGLI